MYTSEPHTSRRLADDGQSAHSVEQSACRLTIEDAHAAVSWLPQEPAWLGVDNSPFRLGRIGGRAECLRAWI